MSDLKIITERLTIRPFVDGDLDDLTVLIRDKMAGKYAFSDTQWPTDDASMKDILAYYMSEEPWSWCAVELNATKHVIGFVCAGGDTTRGFGYTIRSDYQNKGYASEAGDALLNYCIKNLGTTRFVAGTADCNIPSVKLLLKLGFSKIRSFEGSFAKDATGNSITFAAGEYERIV